MKKLPLKTSISEGNIRSSFFISETNTIPDSDCQVEPGRLDIRLYNFLNHAAIFSTPSSIVSIETAYTSRI